MPPKPKPRRKRLTVSKSKTYYALKKVKKQICHPTPPRPLPNEVSHPVASSTNNNEIIIIQYLHESPNRDDACHAQVPMENCLSLPSATPPTSPVSLSTLNEETDCLISPSTGVLRSRTNILLTGDGGVCEEKELVYSTPLKRSISIAVRQQSPDAGASDDRSTFPFSSDAPEEQRLESPIPDTTPTNEVFTVSSMCLMDTATSDAVQSDSDPVLPHPSKGKISNAETSTPKQDSPFQTAVENLLRAQLPRAWELALTSLRTAFILRMNSSDDFWGAIQRSVLISQDGTVHIKVHNNPMGLDHPIWQELPCRVCLFDWESVDGFVQYVRDVVDVIRSYVVCIGIPESQYSELAANNPSLVFDSNPFMEGRFTVTYRSVNCEKLVTTKCRMKKYCSFCSRARHIILRRQRELLQSPHANLNYECLDSTQENTEIRKLKNLSRKKENSKQVT